MACPAYARSNFSWWSCGSLLTITVRPRISSSSCTGHARPNSRLAAAIGRDFKGKLSPVLYALGVAAAFFRPWMSCALYVFVALMWLIPDRRIERIARGPRQQINNPSRLAAPGRQSPSFSGDQLKTGTTDPPRFTAAVRTGLSARRRSSRNRTRVEGFTGSASTG